MKKSKETFWPTQYVVEGESFRKGGLGPSVSLRHIHQHFIFWGTDLMPQPQIILSRPSFSIFSSVQFSRSVVSNSLRPHESQHARPPCPSPTPGVHSNSCPLSQWCHPAISSSVVPFSSCLNPSQHQSLLQWVNSLHEVAKVLEFQLQHRSFQRTPRTDLL